MLYLTKETKILLALKPVDFRKQFDGLIAVCENELQQSSRSGVFFVFINKSKTMLRVLNYEGGGYWLATKRLSRGKYIGWPRDGELVQQMQAEKLTKLLTRVFTPKQKTC